MMTNQKSETTQQRGGWGWGGGHGVAQPVLGRLAENSTNGHLLCLASLRHPLLPIVSQKAVVEGSIPLLKC